MIRKLLSNFLFWFYLPKQISALVKCFARQEMEIYELRKQIKDLRSRTGTAYEYDYKEPNILK